MAVPGRTLPRGGSIPTLPCAARGMSGHPGPTAGAEGGSGGGGPPQPQLLSRGKKLGTALFSCWDCGHLHAGSLPPAAAKTHSAHARLSRMETCCSHRTPEWGDLPSGRGGPCLGERSQCCRTPTTSWTMTVLYGRKATLMGCS